MPDARVMKNDDSASSSRPPAVDPVGVVEDGQHPAMRCSPEELAELRRRCEELDLDSATPASHLIELMRADDRAALAELARLA